jgi:hypothetical protein
VGDADGKDVPGVALDGTDEPGSPGGVADSEALALAPIRNEAAEATIITLRCDDLIRRPSGFPPLS